MSERNPWKALGISRATYYRKFRPPQQSHNDETVSQALPPEAYRSGETVSISPANETKISQKSETNRETVSKAEKKLEGYKPWQIKPGQVLNPAGRPKGSRNKLTQAFIDAMCADFEKHGDAVIEAVRGTKPEAYLAVMARIIPQQMEVGEAGAFTDMADTELDTFIAKTMQLLRDDASGTVH